MSINTEVYACNLYAERTEADHAVITYKYLCSPPLRSFYVELMLQWTSGRYSAESPTCRDTQRRADGGDSPAWWGPARTPASLQ
ncbi:hypothetical protein N7527_008861 [Penicillium freii]|nr:hypothetical protein N7527_008861 [Penicillium freii]